MRATRIVAIAVWASVGLAHAGDEVAEPTGAEGAVPELERAAEDAAVEPATSEPQDPAPSESPPAEASEPAAGSSVEPSEDGSSPKTVTPQEDDWVDAEVRAFLEKQNVVGTDGLVIPKFSLGGFADVAIRSSTSEPIPGFSIGQLVGHGRVDFGKGFGAFAEVTINSTPSWQVRVERLMFMYERSDAFRISLGRFHLPVTWWNAQFHHGLWLQTSIRRPLLIGYSDAWIPNHTTGLRFDGRLPFLDSLGLSYHLGLTGGGSEHSHDGTESATHPHPTRLAMTWGLKMQPRAVADLTIGTFGYVDPWHLRGERRFFEAAIGSHIVYASELPEVIVEYVTILHRPEDTGELFVSHGGYAQLGVRLRGKAERFKPYVRYEATFVSTEDPTLVTKSSEQLGLGGLRCDLTSWLALKAEGVWRYTRLTGHGYEAGLQVSATW